MRSAERMCRLANSRDQANKETREGGQVGTVVMWEAPGPSEAATHPAHIAVQERGHGVDKSHSVLRKSEYLAFSVKSPFFFLVFSFRTAPKAYRHSQARRRIRAVAG